MKVCLSHNNSKRNLFQNKPTFFFRESVCNRITPKKSSPSRSCFFN